MRDPLTQLWRLLPPLLLTSLGCQVVLDFEDFSRETAATTDGGAGAPSTDSGASSTTGTTTCSASDLGPDLKGPDLLLVADYGGGCLWIDATEITRAQYQEFLDDTPDLESQVGYCDWNESFEPDPGCGQGSAIQENLEPKSPIVCVDECDAFEYCEWAGKHLCGGTGLDDTQNEWYAACSSNGQNEYPYGNDYHSGACLDTGCNEGSSCTPIQTGALTRCKTPGGASDMTGNVAEWVDTCDRTLGAADNCDVRGGGVNDGSNSASCDVIVSRKRSFTHPALGFRCCAG